MSIPARCALPSVDLLREAYGPRRSFWGDLSARETRIFYKELLPVSIQLEVLAGRAGNRTAPSASALVTADADANVDGSFDVDQSLVVGGSNHGDSEGSRVSGSESVDGAGGLSLEELARLASTARHAARLYARERCALPSRVVAHLYDGLRHLKNYGTFRFVPTAQYSSTLCLYRRNMKMGVLRILTCKRNPACSLQRALSYRDIVLIMHHECGRHRKYVCHGFSATTGP